MCGSMVDIQSATAEIRRGNKKDRKKEEERNHMMKIWSALLHMATIKIKLTSVSVSYKYHHFKTANINILTANSKRPQILNTEATY